VSPMCYRTRPGRRGWRHNGNNAAKDPDMSGAWHRAQLMTRSLAKRLLLDAGRALANSRQGGRTGADSANEGWPHTPKDRLR
jgi:hypothetical protein